MTLVYDIETKTQGRPNPDVDSMRFVGAIDIDTNEKYFFSFHQRDEIINLFKKHQILIGYNNFHYDDAIMLREEYITKNHLFIDAYDIIKKRAVLLQCKQRSKSLKSMAEFFKLAIQKGEIDFDILKQEAWTDAQIEEIKKYCINDVKLTLQVYQKLVEFFIPLKEYLNKYDNSKYKWLTSSVAVYAYKAICNLANIKETYADDVDRIAYEGGYVSTPPVKEEHDHIYCYDYNSLYPMNMIQANLFSSRCKCCKEEDKWDGNGFYQIKGRYCKKKHGHIESILLDIYRKRVEYKKNKDPRQFALKIILNTVYGLLGNPSFKSLYDHNAARDCTSIGRTSIKHAINKFKSAGYLVLYTDTDSVYLKDVYEDPKRIEMVKNSIIKDLKANLTFPVKEFDMGIDDRIKHIFFFKKNRQYLKKMYIYVTEADKLKIKGLPIIKKDTTKLSKVVFDKYMKEKIRSGDIDFNLSDIKSWILDEIKRDISIASRSFRVNDISTYKNTTNIFYQISKKYGAGTHDLVANMYVGVGNATKYCTIEEFKKANLGIDSLILNKTYSELSYFLDHVPRDKKAVNFNIKKQNLLAKWSEI